MARLFVAVALPAAAADVVTSPPRPARPDLRWTPRENLHVTLRFLGDAVVEEVASALDDAALPHATAVLGPTVEVLGGRLLVVPVAGLDELAGAVVDATAGFGDPPAGRPFRGHVTLARRRGASRRPLPTPATAVTASFEVDDVALVDSDTLPTGAVHTVLGRWPVG